MVCYFSKFVSLIYRQRGQYFVRFFKLLVSIILFQSTQTIAANYKPFLYIFPILVQAVNSECPCSYRGSCSDDEAEKQCKMAGKAVDTIVESRLEYAEEYFEWINEDNTLSPRQSMFLSAKLYQALASQENKPVPDCHNGLETRTKVPGYKYQCYSPELTAQCKMVQTRIANYSEAIGLDLEKMIIEDPESADLELTNNGTLTEQSKNFVDSINDLSDVDTPEVFCTANSNFNFNSTSSSASMLHPSIVSGLLVSSVVLLF